MFRSPWICSFFSIEGRDAELPFLTFAHCYCLFWGVSYRPKGYNLEWNPFKRLLPQYNRSSVLLGRVMNAINKIMQCLPGEGEEIRIHCESELFADDQKNQQQ